MTATLFHHPDAGRDSWSATRLLEALRAVGIEAVYRSMDEPGWEEALAGTDELAVVAGGDGTVSTVATHLGDHGVPIAILPTGSGNNIARSLGVMLPLAEAIARIPHARPSPMRVGRAEGSWGCRRFLEGIGLGALAHATAALQEEELDGAEKLRRGREHLAELVGRMEPVTVTVTADGVPVPGEFLALEVLNLPMIGANLRLVDDLPLADDRLAVATLAVADRHAFVRWLRGDATGISPLRHIRAALVHLTGDPQPLRLEDKSLDWDGSPVTVTVEATRVQVLRPGDVA